MYNCASHGPRSAASHAQARCTHSRRWWARRWARYIVDLGSNLAIITGGPPSCAADRLNGNQVLIAASSAHLLHQRWTGQRADSVRTEPNKQYQVISRQRRVSTPDSIQISAVVPALPRTPLAPYRASTRSRLSTAKSPARA